MKFSTIGFIFWMMVNDNLVWLFTITPEKYQALVLGTTIVSIFAQLLLIFGWFMTQTCLDKKICIEDSEDKTDGVPENIQ